MIKPHRGRHRNKRIDPHEVAAALVIRTGYEEGGEEEDLEGRDSQKQQQRYYPASRRRLHNSQLMVVITVILALFQIQMGMSRVLMSLNRKCISCPCPVLYSSPQVSCTHCSLAVCLPVSQSANRQCVSLPGEGEGEEKRDLMKFPEKLSELQCRPYVFYCNSIPVILTCHERESLKLKMACDTIRYDTPTRLLLQQVQIRPGNREATTTIWSRLQPEWKHKLGLIFCNCII